MSNPPFGDFASWLRIAEILFAQDRRALVALALTCSTFRAQFLREDQLLAWAGYDPEHIKHLAERWCVPYSRNVIISMLVSRQTNGNDHQHYCYNCGAEALRFIDVDSNPLCPAICCACHREQKESWIQCARIVRREKIIKAFALRHLTYDEQNQRCQCYIMTGTNEGIPITAEELATYAARSRFLHKYAKRFAVRTLAQNLLSEYAHNILPTRCIIQHIIEQLLLLSLPGNTYPDVFPWENKERRCIWNAHPEYTYSTRRITNILAKPHIYLAHRIVM